jgi:hypothetical protein
MKYTRVITKSNTCEHCGGTQEVWEKEYHEQMTRKPCRYCTDGKRDFTTVEDATDYVHQLEAQNHELILKLQKVDVMITMFNNLKN